MDKSRKDDSYPSSPYEMMLILIIDDDSILMTDYNQVDCADDCAIVIRPSKCRRYLDEEDWHTLSTKAEHIYIHWIGRRSIEEEEED